MNRVCRLPRRVLYCQKIRLRFCAVVVQLLALAGVVRSDEITNSLGMTLRLLDAGRFEMGARDITPGFYEDHSEFNTAEDARPVHPVVLTKPFYMATTEVTRGQFRRFVEETGYRTSAEQNPRGAVGWDPEPPTDNPRFVSTFRDGGEFHWKQPGFEQSDEHPAVAVSFVDAKAFCDWLSKQEGVPYRLPTEAEWEYAARAGTQTYFSFGDPYRGRIQRYANIGNVELEKAFPDRVRRQWLIDVEHDPADRHVFTAPVAEYEPNPWGLFDLYGNVWEWCEDRYLDTAYRPYVRPGYQQLRERSIDPLNLEKASGEGDWRVIRGGSWFNAPVQCRSAVRGYFEASDAACFLGFRVVREAPEEVVTAARQRFAESEAARETLQGLLERFQEWRDGRLTLHLRLDNLNDEFFAALQALDEPVDLYLHADNRLTAAGIAELAKARKLTGLLLSATGPQLSDSDFAVLESHLELELLQITGAPKLTDGLLASLRNHDRLELLHLDGQGITDEGLRRLPSLKQLEKLQLAGTSSQGLILEHFSDSPLRTFSCSGLTDQGARLLGSFDQLRDLSLDGSPITGEGLSAIAALSWLDRLSLQNCASLRDADFAVLGNLYDLRTAQLQHTSAGDAAVTGLTRLNNLRELQIGSEKLSDAGVRRICEIVSLHNLVLTEDASSVTDAGLADLWRLVNLRSLSIGAPRITGSGLATLDELPKLDWMQLTGPGIGDVALQHAAQSPTLQRIFVGNWQNGGPPELTDAGLAHLAESRSLKQVDVIRRETSLTDEAAERLRERRPQLNVNLR
ncbi:SUMF1/EgtB/PvdO family nonheme iron enzyme [bacterium]|nr:SUMF1/EgtB/PvdO family nonheme iron enzyme [bacterium]